MIADAILCLLGCVTSYSLYPESHNARLIREESTCSGLVLRLRLSGTEWRCRRGLAYPREHAKQPTLSEYVVHFLGYIIHSRFKFDSLIGSDRDGA
ncbi:uncharacterized protein BKA55DRAFT_576070 [Fusarium redolens]|uniref:Secreted protein n=1 Tax=Fusarium redolens TaxID=48865 RepID=A0A9P9GN42_FUSRE|nr:uncharacterized protein BKA55DRAFT_576070 [Fusarium redolens]KAH7240937.1 hypothetical protein BKA55DRAFT_576070 [Fusarium redolens]